MKFNRTTSVAGQTQQLVGSEDAVKSFERFYDSDNVENILSSFDSVCEALDIHPGRFKDFFPILKNALADKLSYKYKELWKILERKSKLRVYGGNKADPKVLVIGAGPVGLRLVNSGPAPLYCTGWPKLKNFFGTSTYQNRQSRETASLDRFRFLLN